MQYPINLPNWPLELIEQRFSANFHGDYPRWQEAIDRLPPSAGCHVHMRDTVHLDMQLTQDISTDLQQLCPWRKGPFQFGQLRIETEWRSDWKWQRIEPHISLANHRVLDVGCGNGYFGWRMLQAGATEVVGIDPTLLFCMQHRAVQHFADDPRNWVLPLGIEEIPTQPTFDSVFSMGVIYHRRSPQAHIEQLRDLLHPGGQLLIESIVTEAAQGFKPKARYARMRNVWWIPSVQELVSWLHDAGFARVECLDVSVTTVAEQHATPWMTFESLAECLDPQDSEKTIEGYPAPKRAVILAQSAL